MKNTKIRGNKPDFQRNHVFDHTVKIENTIPLKISLVPPENRVLREILVKTHFSGLSYPLYMTLAKYLSIFLSYGESCCNIFLKKFRIQAGFEV